jgi:hypothetical protein
MATALMGQRHDRSDRFDFKNHSEPPTGSVERRRSHYAPFGGQWTHGIQIYKRRKALEIPHWRWKFQTVEFTADPKKSR